MNPRRRLLTVIIHDVPPPTPRVGEIVEVWLGQKEEGPVEGRVYQTLGFGVIRVQLDELQEMYP